MHKKSRSVKLKKMLISRKSTYTVFFPSRVDGDTVMKKIFSKKQLEDNITPLRILLKWVQNSKFNYDCQVQYTSDLFYFRIKILQTRILFIKRNSKNRYKVNRIQSKYKFNRNSSKIQGIEARDWRSTACGRRE